MAEIPYPKVKYQGAAAAVPYDAAKPGFIYQKVANAEEEKALEGQWFDTPAEAIKAGPPKGSEAPGGASPAAHQGDARNTGEWPTESEKRKR